MEDKEYLLQKVENRFTLLPIKHKNLYDFFKDHQRCFWTTEEIDLTVDVLDWERKLNDNERYFIENILAFFAGSDGIVNENLVLNFYKDIELPEVRAFYGMQILIENIHSETYSVLIESLIKNESKKAKLFNAINTIPAVKKKADWAINWIEKKDGDDVNKSFVKRLIAFVIVEGLFFSGSFCSIYWLKNRGLMPGLCFSNELISRDEGLHAMFGIELYSMVQNKLNEKEIHDMFKEAVDIEKEFITESLPVSLIGMNSDMMKDYIEYVANKLLSMMGYKKLYNIQECPFKFMELLSFSGGNSKVNFFEKRNSDYSKPNVGKTAEENELGFDEDF